MLKKYNVRVIVAPLDWGLGHSTRCIPIIRYLLQNNCTVFIATDGAPQSLLQIEFPDLQFLTLKGYEIKYTNKERLLPIKIIQQLPKLLNIIRYEHAWLKKMVSNHAIDLIISDNRYGFWHPAVTSIFITHQLCIKGPYKWIEKLLQQVNYKHINRFNYCWVPDFIGQPNLAGVLSHPVRLPDIPVKYLGPLSRFENTDNEHFIYDLLVVLSGPEPQRNILEQKILSCLNNYEGKVLLVRGLPENAGKPSLAGNTTIVNHLNAAELELAYLQARFVVSRAGYTTIMDIIKIRKKAVLIPTPGQTEQLYLGQYLQEQNLCLCVSQNDFNLQKALESARLFNYRFPVFAMDTYKNIIDELLENFNQNDPVNKFG